MCDFLRGAPGPTIATARMSEGIRSNGDLYTCSIFCFCWWYFLWESAHRVRRVSSHIPFIDPLITAATAAALLPRLLMSGVKVAGRC